MEHDEIYEDIWEEKENEWLPYVKNHVLSTAFFYARYTMGMEELTSFGMKTVQIHRLQQIDILIVWEMKTLNQYILMPIYLWEILYVKQLKSVDVMLLTNIINLKFRMECLLLFQKK